MVPMNTPKTTPSPMPITPDMIVRTAQLFIPSSAAMASGDGSSTAAYVLRSRLGGGQDGTGGAGGSGAGGSGAGGASAGGGPPPPRGGGGGAPAWRGSRAGGGGRDWRLESG